MTDVHSHILFGIDDGCKDIKESIELLKKMKDVGFDSIILTPHYMTGSEYSSNNKEKERLFEELKKEIQKEKIKINIYLGNEVFIDNKIINLLDNGEITPINNTNYLLIELPLHNQILNLDEILYEIKLKGYIPIIAHPERYRYFQKDKKLVNKLKEEGVLFQANYYSIIGGYGKYSQKLLKYMLKKNYIDYLGTDIHHINKIEVLDSFEKIENKIKKYTKDYYKTIQNNCNKLVK